MRHRMLTIEKPGSREQKRASTDGRDTAGTCAGCGNPCDEILVVFAGFRATAASDDQCVDRPANFLDGLRLAQCDSAICMQRALRPWIPKLNIVSGSVRKDLEGSGHVENLHGRRTDNHNLSHADIL